MPMVRHQAKRKQWHRHMIGGPSKQTYKVLVVIAITENALSKIASVENMLHSAGFDDSCDAGQRVVSVVSE